MTVEIFKPDVVIDSLRPADYNPRRITDESLARLVESLKTLGIIKPVIALEDGLIVAGHQRSRAARIAGFTHTPVCYLTKKPNPQDEIRFNQLHNGTDLDSGAEDCWVEPSETEGFAMSRVVKGNFRAVGAGVRNEVAQMLTAYGNWGGCVASMQGQVLSSASYALAASVIGFPVRVFYVDDEKAELVREIFSQAYGQYDYTKIKRESYNQTFAQPFRLRSANNNDASVAYEKLVSTFPKSTRILDFGCGQGDYVRTLKKLDFDIHGVEFFRRKGGKLDISASQKMIDGLILGIKHFGLFDVVVCDFVINSVDSPQAENDVLACVNAFLKPGGTAFFSGRTMDLTATAHESTLDSTRRRKVQFLDDHNMSALYRADNWFFQKFHTDEQVHELVRRFFNESGEYEFLRSESQWQVVVNKAKQAPDIRGGIEREFNLPLPEGKSFNRHGEVLAAMERFISEGQP
jgi:ParB family transcriptional regulator, chromosome partitioning protein